MISIKIDQGSVLYEALKMHGYEISSAGNKNTTRYVFLSSFPSDVLILTALYLLLL